MTGFLFILGGLLVSGAAIPQLLRLIRRKSSKDISLLFYSVLSLGILAMEVAGILDGQVFFPIANGLALIMTTVIWAFVVKYR